MQHIKHIKKLLVANRGEIAIRIFRAASELEIPTVAIYSHEDRFSLHRYKADEAYQIGKNDEPLKPYLDIEGIIQTAKACGANAIHPGYGFLSENVQLAKRCADEGIIFVGPRPEVMEQLGDKLAAKRLAKKAGVPVIESIEALIEDVGQITPQVQQMGYPVMVKAVSGGGGRGMRIVNTEEELRHAIREASNEAEKAFGDPTVFIEKFIENPKHIEIQLLGDNFGNIVHLYERDCSVQRRFQKVVEVAPAPRIPKEVKEQLYAYALQIANEVQYNNAGTVEFLVDKQQNIYFIEVNPRIQVEHTITEEVTKIDIVRSQILIADGHKLSDPEIFIRSQNDVTIRGYAIQCRITTEDPENNFKPDFGTILTYRNAAGFGIRLDEGSSYSGMKISPFFDSLLVKVSSSGRTLKGASGRLHRALREFRIRGVNTNIGFLMNVISHPIFLEGEADVRFIESHPELLKFPKSKNRANKLLSYIGHITVNGNADVSKVDKNKIFRTPVIPDFPLDAPVPDGTRQKLQTLGADAFAQWLRNEKSIYYTDTTLRDAHQSLLATRMRTIDMIKITESLAHHHPNLFSLECWGGATFDVALRFLHECPWDRLRQLRKAAPNILLQMLIRGSNGVGYKAYPDNLVAKFIEQSAAEGIDVFRIFDSLNLLDEIKVSIEAVRKYTGALAEAAICYTGDMLHKDQRKYTLQYYLDKARWLEDAGAHIIAIKDMAGLLKPNAAEVLIAALKEKTSLPVHLHTHDTSSIQSTTLLKAIEAGVDVVDVCLAAMSGLTSQPNFNALVAMLQGHEREQFIDLKSLNRFSQYWEDVREYYYPFETELKAGTAEVYEHEIPGGQYSNLRPQARALGLEHRFEDIKKNYALANRMLGDLIKVTPSSKIVGDFALFLTTNNLTESDVYEKGATLQFPESVVSFFKGEIGTPEGGFPERLQAIVLKGAKPKVGRSNAGLPDVDFDAEFESFKKQYPENTTFCDFLSYKMYPKIFDEYYKHYQEYGAVEKLPTPTFFYGLKNMEEINVEIAPGKTIIIRLLDISDEPDEMGMRNVIFELNGQARQVKIKDQRFKPLKEPNVKVSAENHVGSPLPGKISNMLVKEGEVVFEKTPLFVIEAMKMETAVTALKAGRVSRIVLKEGCLVEQDDLVLVME
jgi:pyruvate carboxylase